MVLLQPIFKRARILPKESGIFNLYFCLSQQTAPSLYLGRVGARLKRDTLGTNRLRVELLMKSDGDDITASTGRWGLEASLSASCNSSWTRPHLFPYKRQNHIQDQSCDIAPRRLGLPVNANWWSHRCTVGTRHVRLCNKRLCDATWRLVNLLQAITQKQENIRGYLMFYICKES